MVLDVHDRRVAAFLQPCLPAVALLVVERWLAHLHALLAGEALRALADQHDVRRAIHHEAGQSHRVGHAAHARHAAGARVVAHDRGIERDDAVAVRQAPEAHAALAVARLGQLAARNHRVHRAAARSKRLQRAGVGGQTVIPGGEQLHRDGD